MIFFVLYTKCTVLTHWYRCRISQWLWSQWWSRSPRQHRPTWVQLRQTGWQHLAHSCCWRGKEIYRKGKRLRNCTGLGRKDAPLPQSVHVLLNRVVTWEGDEASPCQTKGVKHLSSCIQPSSWFYQLLRLRERETVRCGKVQKQRAYAFSWWVFSR